MASFGGPKQCPIQPLFGASRSQSLTTLVSDPLAGARARSYGQCKAQFFVDAGRNRRCIADTIKQIMENVMARGRQSLNYLYQLSHFRTLHGSASGPAALAFCRLQSIRTWKENVTQEPRGWRFLGNPGQKRGKKGFPPPGFSFSCAK